MEACSSKQYVATPKKAGEKVVRPTQAAIIVNVDFVFSSFPLNTETLKKKNLVRNLSNLVRPSSENLYTISSNKECNDTKTVAELCEQ